MGSVVSKWGKNIFVFVFGKYLPIFAACRSRRLKLVIGKGQVPYRIRMENNMWEDAAEQDKWSVNG